MNCALTDPHGWIVECAFEEGVVVFTQSDVEMIEEMQAVDTTGVELMAHAQEVRQRLRADLVSETDQRDLFQAIAPEVEDGLYLVPKVIE